MEKENKSNTVLLTIIAIATLLVAVVGATFAYFSASSSSNTNVTVRAETRAADIFTSTGSPTINLSVTGAQMQQTDGNDDHTVIASSADADGIVTVSLNAASEYATCSYDVLYTPTTAFVTSSGVANKEELTNKKEFVIFGNSSNDANDFEDVDATGSANIPITLKAGATISDSSDGVTTEETWLFTAKFYNLGTDQSSNANSSFGGTITISNVNCTSYPN